MSCSRTYAGPLSSVDPSGWHGSASSVMTGSGSTPLRTDGEVIGSLNLYDSEPDFFSEEHKAVLEEISSDISYALDSIKAEDARRMAQIAFEREAESTTKILETTGALIIVI